MHLVISVAVNNINANVINNFSSSGQVDAAAGFLKSAARSAIIRNIDAVKIRDAQELYTFAVQHLSVEPQGKQHKRRFFCIKDDDVERQRERPAYSTMVGTRKLQWVHQEALKHENSHVIALVVCMATTLTVKIRIMLTILKLFNFLTFDLIGSTFTSWARVQVISINMDITGSGDSDIKKRVSNGIANGKTPNGTGHSIPKNIPSITEIRRAIPSHCLESTLSESMYYVFQDIAFIIALYATVEWISPLVPSWWQIFIAPAYWMLQGTIFTALFVIGHDCGHASFSNYELINDTIGTILHTFLWAPYFPWKLSHRLHHKNNNNIDKDEVFYPIREKWDDGGFLLPGFGLGLGWVGYMFRGYKPRQVFHFNPIDPLLKDHMIGCLCTYAALATWTMCLYHYTASHGLLYLIYYWGIPTFIFATYNVMITFLHHTDVDVPWYSENNWDYVLGQLSSIDRDYGWAHYLTHNIGTHQIHHLFTKVPHYHLMEATAHFRKAFPELVRYKTDPIIPTFITMFQKYAKHCIVPDNTEIYVYK